MANPNFNATVSSNDIWRDLDTTRCITDDLDAIEADIAEMETGKADADHAHSYNDLSDKPTIPTIPTSLPANGGDADTVGGKTPSDFANAVHDHDNDYIAKSLQFTRDTGDVEFSFNANSGVNILTEINNWSKGFHTAYAVSGTLGNPTANDSFRYLVHKTSANIGWVLAFGGQGCIYVNYDHNGTFRGWRCIHDAYGTRLWAGSYYMAAEHIVTPTKKLSECNHGWILVWSDYDADTSTVNSFDQCTCVIPKKNAAGQNWNGEGYMCVLPSYSDEEGNTDLIIIKNINVYDDKLVGKDKNRTGDGRRDIVLRAVYEF